MKEIVYMAVLVEYIALMIYLTRCCDTTGFYFAISFTILVAISAFISTMDK